MTAPNPMTEGPIPSLFFKYYIPALTSVISIALHQVINGIILGQQVGKEALAAVGLYGPVVIVFISLALPVMIGGGILAGKNIGGKNYAAAKKIFHFETMIAVVFGGIIILLTPFLVTPIANFLAGKENTLLVENSIDYMFWQLIGTPFFFLGMFWGNLVSTDGAPKITRNASLIAVALNIVLDLILIIGLDMGVEGASIATVLSLFASTLYLLSHIIKGKSHYSFNKFSFSLKLKEWRELLNYGLPTFVSEISFSIGLLMINHSAVTYGPSAVTAFGLVNYMSFIFIRLFTAAMISLLRIASYNIGAKLPGRVLSTFKFSLAFTITLGAFITAIGLLIPDLLVRLFSNDNPEEFQETVSNATALYFILFLAAGPNYILAAYFQSIGKSVISSLVNVLKGFVLIGLLLMLLPQSFNLGLEGVWLSRSIAEILTLLLVGIYTIYNKEKFYSENAIIKIG